MVFNAPFNNISVSFIRGENWSTQRKPLTCRTNYCALDLTLLTCGNPTLPYEQNEIIFKHVFEYTKRSERFLIV